MLYALCAALSLALLGLDQWVKHYVTVNIPLGEAQPFLPGLVELRTVHNYGVDLRPVLELPAAQRGAGVLPVQRRAAAAAGKGGHRPAGVDEVHPPHPGGPAFLGRSL